MTERLSDDDLLWCQERFPKHGLLHKAATELLALRTVGPVMPETPSEEVRKAFYDEYDADDCAPDALLELWTTIRNALAKEQRS